MDSARRRQRLVCIVIPPDSLMWRRADRARRADLFGAVNIESAGRADNARTARTASFA
jgi:hypothetical protein